MQATRLIRLPSRPARARPRATPGAKMVVTIDALHGTIGGGELEYQAIDLARGMLRGGGDRRDEAVSRSARTSASTAAVPPISSSRECRKARRWVGVAARWQDAGVRLHGRRRRSTARRGCWCGGRDLGQPRRRALDARAVDTARTMLANGERDDGARSRVGEGLTALFEPLQPSDFNVVLFGAGHVGRALVRVLGPVPCRVTWVDSRADEFPRRRPGQRPRRPDRRAGG